MNPRLVSSSRTGRKAGALLQLLALLTVAVPVADSVFTSPSAQADPAPAAASVTKATAGALPAGTVPDGTCFATVSASGGGGASSATGAGISGGVGGAGATVTATFAVAPGQSYGGTVGAGAPAPTSGAGGLAPGGAGDGSGGSGGTIVTDHRGGGGGGGSSVTFAGTKVLVAGGGGGGGAAHQNSPAGLGGGAGFAGIGAGSVAAGSAGTAGADSAGNGTVGGGQGGQSAAGGAGGVQSNQAARNGSAGTGIGTGTGGNGGPDQNYDSGAGGGGGYTGGGGGASTIGQSQTGAGGGGGSSWVRATSVDAGATVPTGITGAAATATAAGSAPGATGSLSITWVPCNYDLALTKTVSSPSVNAGGKVTWTVTVKNNGPKAMTKGDTVDLTDTLPAGPNGLPAPAYKVTAFTVTPGTSSGGQASGALTCAGVTVGSSMPATTNCSRAYSAPSAVGAPSGGTRGLDVNESFTITYEQIIANTAPCATITNTATVKDRPSGSIVTDTVNTPLTINCYDLAITKTASPTPFVSPSGTITWTISVTNTGPGNMVGPDATGANPLIVTDTFPASGVGTATLTGASGPAGSCSLAGSTTTCTGSLNSGQTETLTYTQVVNAGTADGTVISNTATVSDPKTGDSNDSSTASTRVNRGSMTLTKSASPSSGVVAGTVVTYTFVATNTGSVTINGVTVTDPMSGLSALSCSPANGSALTAGAAMTCTATRTTTQANVDAGVINNTATVAGTTTGGNAVTATGSASVTATQTSTLGLTKTASPNTGVGVGTVVTYTFAGQNTGTTTLHNVGVTDPHAGLSAITCTPAAPATLAPNATINCTATYTVTQADVDAGSIINTASINGLNPSNAPVTKTAGATVTATQTSTLGLTKTASPNTGVGVGTVVTYTFAGQNTGTTTLHNVAVTDPHVGLSAITCTPAAPATLAPNATINCTATYTVTQADVDAGSIINTATISGLNPSNNAVSKTAGATVTATQTSTLGLTKTASPNTGVVAGTVVSYTMNGQNTGTVTLHNVTVTDPLVGAVTCTPAAPATLAPGATITCSGTHTVTQSEVDAGSFLNTATISGLTPANNPVSKTANATVTASTLSTLGLTKTASPNTGVVAGDTVTYTITGTNTGVTTLHTVAVTDPMSGLSAITCTPAAPATLAPGATISCSATYSVTQANVDAGVINNTATISGLNPSNAPVSKTAGATVTATQTSTLGLTKSASPNTGVVAGTVVTYTMNGQNTGTVTLHNVTVTDPLVGAVTCTPSAPATLAPGATITCTGTHTVTQTEVDAGSIINTATIDGLNPTNTPVTKTANATVTASTVSTLGLTKTASPNTGVVAGNLVTYSITGTNTGVTTLHTVAVTDPMTGLSAITCTPAAPATLAPSATITCTATSTVTQADVDAGSIANTATISGLNPTNTPVTKTAGATVTADQTAAVQLTKTATPNTGVVTGDTVSYTFSGQNTGTVTLHNVTVTDPMSGLSAITCLPAAPATLAPGATISCNASYSVTQANVDTGSFTNTATVDGLDPSNTPVNDAASATVTARQVSSIALSKAAAPNTGVVAGDTVSYTFSGQNPGTVTLHNVTVTDPMTGLSAITCLPAAPATLAPGATLSCSASSTVTQADVDAGSFTNTATIDGLNPTNAPVTDTASATVTASTVSTLGLTKTAAPNTGVVAGDTVTYTMTGTNTGVTTLHNVTVTDPMSGLSAISCTPAAPATLAPGATISCSATYTVTQADVDAGSIANTATISGLNPTNTAVTKTANATVTASTTASVSLTKSASPNTGVVAGDSVTYTFTGTNTGVTTLHNVTVTDPMSGLSAITCTPAAPATLAPGATITCSATYTVTQADVDAGSIANTATIDGLDPTDAPVTDTANATVTASTTASLRLAKSASPNTGVVAGDTVTYTMTGTNNGALTVHNVTVTDPMSGLSAIGCTPAAPATLAPGATISCTASYTVTQGDVDASSIGNVAMISGLDPTDNPINATASATVVARTTASFGLTKTASPSAGVKAGDTVTYTMSGTNTGATTLYKVGVSDPMSGLSTVTCTPAAPVTLAPGATITCSATYTVTANDVVAGSVHNTATIDGLDPVDTPVTKSAAATVTTASDASLTLKKTLTKVLDSTATWDIAVTNSGASAFVGPITVTDTLPAGLKFVSADGTGWACTGTTTITCVHAANLAGGTSTSITVVTTITGTGEITNVASLDVLGESVTSRASYTPPGGFAFTGTEAASLGFIGLMGVIAGWFLVLAARKRAEDDEQVLAD